MMLGNALAPWSSRRRDVDFVRPAFAGAKCEAYEACGLKDRERPNPGGS